jgi:hypothetical protein
MALTARNTFNNLKGDARRRLCFCALLANPLVVPGVPREAAIQLFVLVERNWARGGNLVAVFDSGGIREHDKEDCKAIRD